MTRPNVTAGNEVFIPASAWMPVGILRDVVFNVRMSSLIGSFRARPAYQVASVRPDQPDAVVPFGSVSTTQGYHRYAIDLSSSTSDSILWRFGAMVSAASGVAQADLAVWAAVEEYGRVLARVTLEDQPFNSTSDPAIYPIGEWFATTPAIKNVKAAFVLTNVTGNVEYRLFARYADDPSAPSAWVPLESGYTSAPAGNSSRNTGEVLRDPASENRFWTQLGVGVRRASGAPTRASMHVLAVSVGG